MGVIGMKCFGGGYPNSVLIGEGLGQAPYNDLLRYALSQHHGCQVDVLIPGIASSENLAQLIEAVRGLRPMSEYESWLLELRTNQTYIWVSDLKRRPDGCRSEVNDAGDAGVIVTAVFSDCFYVQSEDRSSGIKVANATAALGQRLKVTGELHTDLSGNRYIHADSVEVKSSGASTRPLGLPNWAVGGGDFEFDSESGKGQRGVTGGKGPNNVGLLVKTWGKVVDRGNGWFYVDDGSHVPGPTGSGVRIDCGSITPPGLGAVVSVTGISSLYERLGSYCRCIRLRDTDDIREVTPGQERA